MPDGTLADKVAEATADDEPAKPAEPTGRDRGPSKPKRRSSKSSGSKSSGSKSSGSSSSSKPKGGRQPKSLERDLRKLIEAVGGMVAIVEPFDGACVTDGANQLAKALDAVARDNPSVHRALSLVVSGGGWGGVLMAVAPIALPIAAHHGIVQPSPVVEMMTPKAAREAADTPGLADLFGAAMAETSSNGKPAEDRPAATGNAPPAGVMRVADGVAR